MTQFDRRSALTLMAGAVLSPMATRRALAQSTALSFMTAGQGSAFLPYGRGVAAVLAQAGVGGITIKESKGSNENLSAVDASPGVIGTSFLGSALEAMTGVGFAAGKRHENIRALFPMYETAFMAAALTRRGIGSVSALDGLKVGCGPANGPAEGYFRAVAEIAGVKPVIVSGTPEELGKQLVGGAIDAFWQGASVPIPSLTSVADAADCVVFGLTDREIGEMRRRFPFMADANYPVGTYRGTNADVKTVAAWNVVIAHKDLDEGLAYRITKAVLTAPDLSAAGPAATSTKAINANKNRVVPYHPGALRALKELGVTVD